MKQLLILIIIILSGILITPAQPVKIHGSLHVERTQLMDSSGKPVVIRGMSFGWHNWWPRFYNAGTVNWLVDDWKVTAVRAAMGIEESGGYLEDSASSVEKIKAVVDAAIQNGIYVIIDWHSHNINLNEAKAFFAMMAQTYGSFPNIIYEIFNEPDYETWGEVKAYASAVIDTIRVYDSNNVILVGSPNWDQNLDLVADNPITGYSNIMYTMHFYAATHGAWLRERCDAALEKGIPIFVSESAGTEASGDGLIDYDEWNNYISWMEKNQMSWLCWSISDKAESSAVLNPSAGSTGNWTADDLKESGNRCRELFRKYNYSYEPARIYKAMAKGRRGENLTIGVIGGSITAGYAASTESKRWANLMTDWWKEKFPLSQVNLINAGWGGTGSDIGVHRAYDDLLSKNPDFIVIEFAVNDIEGDPATKMMEGLVQQILSDKNSPGVMFLLLKQSNGTTAQASHKKVADYYHIPTARFADLIDSLVTADGISLSSIFVDGLHPTDVGMAYVANVVKTELDSIFATLPDDDNLPEINTQLPLPLVTDTYSKTFQFFPNNIVPVSNQGWNITESGWNTDVAGNQIDFELSGNAISLIYTRTNGSERGRAEIWVDNGEKTVIDCYMNEDWGTSYSFALAQEGLDNGAHILHIRSIDESSTSGHSVYISRILTAGSINSAPPIAKINSYKKGLINRSLKLDATESFDPEGDAIGSYHWSVTESPENSSAVITHPDDSIIYFTPDLAGTYTISLVVSVGLSQSVAASVQLDIRATNNTPLAVAGRDTTYATKKYFRFNGSNSYDLDGDHLSYKWLLESAPNGSQANIISSDNIEAQCKFDKEGTYVVSLTAYDSIDYSEKSYITITAIEGYSQINEQNQPVKTNNISPNPTTGQVNISYLTHQMNPITIEIYSIIGIKMGELTKFPTTTGLNSFNLSLKEYVKSPGIYFIKLSSGNTTSASKITVL